MKIIIAAVFAIGMATAAYAQEEAKQAVAKQEVAKAVDSLKIIAVDDCDTVDDATELPGFSDFVAAHPSPLKSSGELAIKMVDPLEQAAAQSKVMK